MRLLWLALSALASITLAHSRQPVKRDYETHDYYVIEHVPIEQDAIIKRGAIIEQDATFEQGATVGASIDEVARALGVEVVEQLGELQDHWLVRSPKLSQDLQVRGEDPVLDAYQSLRNIAQGRQLSTRSESDDNFKYSKRMYDSIAFIERQELEHREKRAPPSARPPPKYATIGKDFGIMDPYFPMQWHLANDDYPEHMMNVSGLWAEGLTGKGVTSGLIDDGLDYTTDDLAGNFDAKNSFDFNDHGPLPTPRNFLDTHGTRCAGQIAAMENDVCGVGIAYDSKVAGIRILGGRLTVADEAIALNYGYQDISLYSCSWGPRDDGTKMQGPRYIVRKAVLNGINEGRGGKGSVFVFASGNGGDMGDQCNFDGYTNSIYSVTVGAVDHTGLHPGYSETCAANMIVAYSSGSGKHIVTTDRGNGCAVTHGGTSAAAPNVVGVFALALQARPDLTWRDMQYLCVETARRINPNDPDWSKIANGKYHSNKYGFGVLDGWHYVQAAKTWKLVKPQAWFEVPTIRLGNGTMGPDGKFKGGESIVPGGVSSTAWITEEMLAEHNLETLEHVNVRVWIGHTRRGDVSVELTSPTGINSVLASPRGADDDKTGYPGWTFMSVKHWGDNPVGNWTIRVSDQESSVRGGHFLGWNMILWGTTTDPSKAKKYVIDKDDDLLPDPRNCSATTVTSKPKPTAGSPQDAYIPTDVVGWLFDLFGSKQNWFTGVVEMWLRLTSWFS